MGSNQASEKRLPEAIEFKLQYPDVSFRWLESQFDVKKDRINRRWNKTHTESQRRPEGLCNSILSIRTPQLLLRIKEKRQEYEKEARAVAQKHARHIAKTGTKRKLML
jgi:hypothetical protein